MKRYRITFKGKNSQQRMTLLARNADEAKVLAERAHFRRHERFPLTLARLEQAKETGEAGLLGMNPGRTAVATGDWVKAEVERRKRDQARYDSGELKITRVEEVK